MRQFAVEIPDSLLESARIDGWSEWGIFRRIVLPLLKPAIAVLAIIEFVNNWNSFAVPFVLINSPEKRTLQLALADLRMAYEITPWSQVMAASVITVTPILVLFLVFQKGLRRREVSLAERPADLEGLLAIRGTTGAAAGDEN